ncbi:pyridoxal-phosphate dependent enzyme [Xylanibacillus composti]|uniref:D-cysteine desulfhydrase n=1 Tax=Xylanibacillus composti TaxID=1572762 RepID=A0A8J4M4H6_9BACL|nr:pyridoxal-phosphate dependent enzyme [Xylanibacillus composti]MDT9725944.1 pyridoxal-phosphate dependent enzyme [Xylanibacillus composti]GIQ71257.1 D-cysteine desulfhydrase [Xylanibacillus composti]
MKIRLDCHTPIQKLEDEFFGNTIYVKRDDLLPLSFGGNKLRKALLFFEDIKRNGANCVITYGSEKSNHCRVIANIAAVNNIPCYIISPNGTNGRSNNTELILMFGANIVKCQLHEVQETINNQISHLRSLGYLPYFIQGGGHGDIGTQAYVEAYNEIVEYERSQNISFDMIFHASGTGTTQAGLVCGNIINGHKKEIVGVSIARKNPRGKEIVIESVKSYLNGRKLKSEGISENSIEFIDDYIIDGYGTINDSVIHTVKDIMIKECIPLDLTYTGKAFWGMKSYIRKKRITNKNILFIHTGGTPLFFDNLGALLNG